MDPSTIVVGALSLIGMVGVPIVTYKLTGRRQTELSEQQAEVHERQSEVLNAQNLSATAINLMTHMEGRMNAAEAKAVTAQTELAEMRHRIERLERIEAAAHLEATWAIQARDALLEQRWPAGLAHTPPILAVIPPAPTGR